MFQACRPPYCSSGLPGTGLYKMPWQLAIAVCLQVGAMLTLGQTLLCLTWPARLLGSNMAS